MGVAAGDEVSVDTAENVSVLTSVILGVTETEVDDEATGVALTVIDAAADDVEESIPEGVGDSMDDEDGVDSAEND